MARPTDPSFSDSLKSDQRKSFYEGHTDIALTMILVVFLFPIVGAYINGVFGAALGVALSVLGYYLTPYAVQKLGL